MFANKFRRLEGVTALLVLVGGCATTSAPDGWLPEPEQMETNAFGGWVQLRYKVEGSSMDVDGELIAVEPTSVYVLSDSGIHAIPASDIKEAEVMGYEIHAGSVAAWMFAGMVSTLSHGFYLIITVPAWLISGGISASAVSREPLISYPQYSLQSLRLYSRFPQGLPPGLDLLTLKRKPFTPR